MKIRPLKIRLAVPDGSITRTTSVLVLAMVSTPAEAPAKDVKLALVGVRVMDTELVLAGAPAKVTTMAMAVVRAQSHEQNRVLPV